MLVLSRRAQQQISFPNLGVTLSILQVRGRIVKVGIEAPPEITVLRREMLSSDSDTDPPESASGQPPAVSGQLPAVSGQSPAAFENARPPADSHSRDNVEHWRRNQLNTLGLYLDAIQMRLDQGEMDGAKTMVERLISNLNHDDRKFAPPLSQTSQGIELEPLKPDAPPTRLLIVEDSDNERGLMTLLLASYGFIVHVARDGAEAFEQLQQWGVLPDIVLMDMQMPMYNGLEALQRIREEERLRDLVVYAVTGSRRDPENEPSGRGWDRWFTKPIDMAALVLAIQEDDGLIRKVNQGQVGQGVVACHFS